MYAKDSTFQSAYHLLSSVPGRLISFLVFYKAGMTWTPLKYNGVSGPLKLLYFLIHMTVVGR